MDKKNVWIINHYAIPPSLGGLNRHYYFTRELIKRGYNVRIFSSSAIHNTDINMISLKEKCRFKEADMDGVTYTYIKSNSYKGNGLSRIKNMLAFMFNIKRIRKYYKNEKPDVIYTSSPDIFAAYASLKLAKKMKLPCITEIRDLWPLSIVEYNGMSNHNPIISILYKLEKWIYKKSNALIFTMPGCKDYLIDKKWDKIIGLDKVFYINNGIDLDETIKMKNENLCQDEILESNTFKVVYAGSIRKANRIDKLVDVAKKIQEKGIDDIKFLIYGDGGYKPMLETTCKEEHIENVYFKGRVAKRDLPNILSKCSLAMLIYQNANTWKYGGSQNKVFDYLAVGLPVLSNVKMGHSIFDEYDCGISVDDDIDAIAKGVIDFYNLDKERYTQMQKNAINAAKDYDYKKLVDKLEHVFEFATLKGK